MLALLVALAFPALAVDAPVSLTASDGSGLALTGYEVDTVITGPLAFTELRLAFDNPQDRVIEGRFRLVLPDGAAVSRFAMKIDGQFQEGEVVELVGVRLHVLANGAVYDLETRTGSLGDHRTRGR